MKRKVCLGTLVHYEQTCRERVARPYSPAQPWADGDALPWNPALTAATATTTTMQGLTLVANSAQLELFGATYNPT